LKLSGTILSTRITNSMHAFSSSVTHIHQYQKRREGYKGKILTSPETRPPTERAAAPQMAVHHPCAHELEEEIERVLELVVHLGALERRVHRAREGRVRVCVDEEAGGRGR
jgi:hypothetical protein